MKQIISRFKYRFHHNPDYIIDTGGRLEIVGNHTDHNHGLCLVANCSLRVIAGVKKDLEKVSIFSRGYQIMQFDVSDLSKKTEEEKTTLGMCKGVLFKLKEYGYKVGGFECYMESEIPNGGGVSSSAAVESLFGYIISYLYNDGKITPIEIAKAGQFSENVYFGKPCGLLDQIGTSFDDCNTIDFKNVEDPKIQTLNFNLPLDLYLIKSKGNHSNLTHLYKEIPDSMYLVANKFGKNYLRDCEEDNILEKVNSLDLDDRIKNKAIHFFNENINVTEATKAIKNNDVETFLNIIRKTQDSSKNNLRNTYVQGEYRGSPQYIIDKVSAYLQDKGAIRVHGGGFKGTTLCFVKKENSVEFEQFLRNNLQGYKFFKVAISPKAVNFIKL